MVRFDWIDCRTRGRTVAASRIIILGVAAASAGGAGYVAKNMAAPPPVQVALESGPQQPSIELTDVLVLTADGEPNAGNCVQAGDRLVMAAGSPRTVARLRDRGFHVVEVDLSELQKAEAGGTCMSLIGD